ncbi:hypothetical protein GCM10009557_06540 [Virgisporangium ochraceum]|uniref:Uncharacterized protein n=1 Tax=Virgisporangium ochraceum TaxID=65505 RepID=A0A8J4E955_9ACTN|nr:hypothetical protein [Virgisporangium ochraceum]GIJ65953.1 hypothetical protein Voc01_008700 [Virgisporangium ochraceum]
MYPVRPSPSVTLPTCAAVRIRTGHLPAGGDGPLAVVEGVLLPRSNALADEHQARTRSPGMVAVPLVREIAGVLAPPVPSPDGAEDSISPSEE